MNWVSGTLSIGMLGIFLPFTIYLQSALGFSALKAGLTMAPSSVVMIILAPVLGRLTDKIGGKYILMTGLTLFAVGMGWAVLIATPHSAWYDFLAPMIVAGLGMGGTFPPMTTTAMRDVDPRMAGAASGVLNTTRQVGSVIGTAAVGALLQNRLVSSLTSHATAAAAALPPAARGPVVSGFRKAASSGLIGGAPSGSAAPAGTSPTLAAQLRRLGAEVFAQGYVHAMQWTMVLPITVVALAAASCLLLKGKAAGQGDAAAVADSGQMAGTISSPGSSGSLGQSPGSSSGTAS
jgi:MFS family permease